MDKQAAGNQRRKACSGQTGPWSPCGFPDARDLHDACLSRDCDGLDDVRVHDGMAMMVDVAAAAAAAGRGCGDEGDCGRRRVSQCVARACGWPG